MWGELSAVAAVVACAAAGSVPNVLILLTDDVGWGDVGYNCKNATVCPQTPNIDALATGDHAVLFHRFYSGAGVCSPTRASVLTGRSNKRGCIDSALPCDHMASGAANCSQGPGLSWNEFTIAHAATKAGVPSIHLGKWHLGDLWDKKLGGGKWPANLPHHSNPGDHGFTRWASSQSQLPTSTPNCGCFPPEGWVPPAEQPPSLNTSTAGMKFKHTYPGEDCVIGGGVLVNESFVCSTYWHPDNASATGVAPAGEKIVGDDGAYMVDQLSTFIDSSTGAGKSFLATLWLHYIHLPHPALPKFYDMYENDPDYVGALGQMDATVGELVSLLQTKNVFNNTLLFFTSDNGCHCDESAALWPQVQCGKIHVGRSNAGLRGCKASNWEGGIRVPGFLVWPDRIKANVETWVPAVTHDLLPTVLEAYGVEPDHPERVLDGVSMLPFVDGPVPVARSKPIGFWWGGNQAWIDNDVKLVAGDITPGQGCTLEPPYTSAKGPFLYNLTSDTTESVDLSKSNPALFASMSAALATWVANVSASAAENGCGGTGPAPPAPPPGPPAPPSPAWANCTFEVGVCGYGDDLDLLHGLSRQQCCDACRARSGCDVAVSNDNGDCHIKDPAAVKEGRPCKGFASCHARNKTIAD